MLKDLFIQYLPTILYFLITIFLGVITYFVKGFLKSKKTYLDHQREELIQKIGIDTYNHDIEIAKGIIKSVEQQAREFNWGSIIKHNTAVNAIANSTGLSNDQIFNIIKSTVNEFNKDKPINPFRKIEQ